jgi:putative DNA primase/helicase
VVADAADWGEPMSTTAQVSAISAPMTLRLTGFEDVHAKKKEEIELSFDQFAKLICEPKPHPSKDSCPLLKLATFGDIRTDKGSLRHDANVLSVYGVEGDYDAGVMPFDEAVARLDMAGVEALVYTTPSYTEEKPKWRVLAPFAEAHTPEQRARFVARLNGVLGGVLARESFITAQTFYFGRVDGADYKAERIDGFRIDTRSDLDARAIGPSAAAQSEPQTPQDEFARTMALRGVGEDTLSDLRDALLNGLRDEYADSYPLWVNAGQALKSLEQAGHGDAALEMWHEFSRRSSKYDESAADQKWETLAPNRITFKSIFEWAQEDAWKNPRSGPALKTCGPEEYSLLEDRSDTGNANMLIRLADGNLRFVPERNLWLWWDGSRWIADEFMSFAFAAAARVAQFHHGKADEFRRQASDSALDEGKVKRIRSIAEDIDKWATRCRSKHFVDNMLAMTSRDSRISVPAAELDKDPWLFGVANGVVDLRSGLLREAARDEFVTKRSPIAFDPTAKATRWKQFIAEITGAPRAVEYDERSGLVKHDTVGRYDARPDLASYLQRALGYCCTARTDQHKMFLAIGAGSNGKNVLLDIVQEVMGDYCRTIPPEALMASRHDADSERPSPTAASLAASRLAISSESRDGQKLDVALVKRHTGGGYMTARLMRENTFRFEITHKLVLMTNHRPSLDHLDDALRGRLHLVPFDRVWNRPGHTERNETLPDGDPGLMDELRAEAPGVLAWLIEGAVKYAGDGLTPPQEVVRMTRAYFAEQDPVGRWLETMERCAPEHGTPARELYNTFLLWHRDEDEGNGKAPDTEKAFSNILEGRGITKKKTKAANKFGLTSKKTNET